VSNAVGVGEGDGLGDGDGDGDGLGEGEGVITGSWKLPKSLLVDELPEVTVTL